MAPREPATVLSAFNRPFDLQEWVKIGVTLEVDSSFRTRIPAPAIVCADGTTLSVQAGTNFYSTPRKDDADEYTHFEVGFPSSPPPAAWKDYAEEWGNPTETVYAQVPEELLLFFIAAHGGVDMQLTKSAGMKWIEEYESYIRAAAVQAPDRIRYIF